MKALLLAVLLFVSQAVFAQTTITTVDRFNCGRQLACNNIPNDQFDEAGVMWDLDITSTLVTVNGVVYGPAGLVFTSLGAVPGAYALNAYSLAGTALGTDGTVAIVNISLTHYHGAGSGRGGCYGCNYRWYVSSGSTVTIQ